MQKPTIDEKRKKPLAKGEEVKCFFVFFFFLFFFFFCFFFFLLFFLF